MKDKEEVIKQLKITPIVQIACQKSNISRSVYYFWRKKDIPFRKKSDRAIKSGTNFINDLAESQLISQIKDKNMTAIIYWLNHKHKDYLNKQVFFSQSDRKLILEAIKSDNLKDAYQNIFFAIKGKVSDSVLKVVRSAFKKELLGEDKNEFKKLDLLSRLR